MDFFAIQLSGYRNQELEVAFNKIKAVYKPSCDITRLLGLIPELGVYCCGNYVIIHYPTWKDLITDAAMHGFKKDQRRVNMTTLLSLIALELQRLLIVHNVISLSYIVLDKKTDHFVMSLLQRMFHKKYERDALILSRLNCIKKHVTVSFMPPEIDKMIVYRVECNNATPTVKDGVELIPDSIAFLCDPLGEALEIAFDAVFLSALEDALFTLSQDEVEPRDSFSAAMSMAEKVLLDEGTTEAEAMMEARTVIGMSKNNSCNSLLDVSFDGEVMPIVPKDDAIHTALIEHLRTGEPNSQEVTYCFWNDATVSLLSDSPFPNSSRSVSTESAISDLWRLDVGGVPKEGLDDLPEECRNGIAIGFDWDERYVEMVLNGLLDWHFDCDESSRVGIRGKRRRPFEESASMTSVGKSRDFDLCSEE